MSVRAALLAALLLLVAGQAFAGRKLPDTIVLSPEVLDAARQRVLQRDHTIMPVYRALIAEADRAIKAPAESVVLKAKPGPSGDPHDYWSLDPFWWPDPDTPNGLPYVFRDGERNPEADSDKYDRSRLRRMSRDALTLALAYYLTGDEEYSGKGTALVWSWCNDSVTVTNPDLQYAHVRPGISEGHPSGIIETRDLIRIIDAARLLEPSEAWSKVVTRKMKAWIAKYLDWLMKSDFGRQEAANQNSHGTWFDAQAAVFAAFTGDIGLAREIVGTVGQRRIARQIDRDGSMPYEIERPDSRHAVFFNLEAFFVLAAVGDHVDIDLWNWAAPTGPSIKAAFDLAAPHIDPIKPWPHGATGRFDPFDFTPLFHRAALVYKDQSYLDMIKALRPDLLETDRANLFF